MLGNGIKQVYKPAMALEPVISVPIPSTVVSSIRADAQDVDGKMLDGRTKPDLRGLG